MGRFVLAIGVVGLALGGCGGQRASQAPVATASCDTGPHAATAVPGEDGVYRVAAFTLAVGTDLAQTSAVSRARVHGETAVAILTGRSSTVVRVQGGGGVRLALQFTPPPGGGHPQPTLSDGRQAVRFPDCRGGPRGLLVASR